MSDGDDELTAEEELADLEAAEYLRHHPEVVEALRAHDPDLLRQIDVPHEPPADERQ